MKTHETSLLDAVNFTYRYCTEEMIEKAQEETGNIYPVCMEFLEYKYFTVKAKSIEKANEGWITFQSDLGKLFELDDDVKLDIKVDDDEDRYIPHNLKQDFDGYYFTPVKAILN